MNAYRIACRIAPRALAHILPAALLALSLPAMSQPAVAATRTISFRVPDSCSCFECGLEAHKDIGKMAGVRKTSLSVKDRRLDVVLDSEVKPVSEIALAVQKLDMGKDSLLLWSVPKDSDVDGAASALAKVPGVRSARADAKAHAVLLAFTGKPAVTLAQLDSAAGAPPAHG